MGSRSSTARSSASKGRRPSSSRTRDRATGASSRSRLRRSWRRAAPRAGSSVCCPGVIGSLQANEALKLALGIGDPLIGRLMLFDALSASFTEVSIRRDPNCPVGDHPTITEYVDYVEFCAGRMTTVRIPPTLRQDARGSASSPQGASTVARGAHRRRPSATPALRERIFQNDNIVSFVNVYVGGEDIRTQDGLGDAGRGRRHRHPPTGHGRRGAGLAPFSPHRHTPLSS